MENDTKMVTLQIGGDADNVTLHIEGDAKMVTLQIGVDAYNVTLHIGGVI